MNTKTFFVAAIAAFGAASAFASESNFEYPISYTSTVSRASVQAEAIGAIKAGVISQGEQSIVLADSGSNLSRAQVKAETLQAIRVGAIERHEHNMTPTAAQLESIRQAGLKALTMTVASR